MAALKLPRDAVIAEYRFPKRQATPPSKSPGQGLAVFIGAIEGLKVGIGEGTPVGGSEGLKVGVADGNFVGTTEGLEVGVSKGLEVGLTEGTFVGASVGLCVGIIVSSQDTVEYFTFRLGLIPGRPTSKEAKLTPSVGQKQRVRKESSAA